MVETKRSEIVCVVGRRYIEYALWRMVIGHVGLLFANLPTLYKNLQSTQRVVSPHLVGLKLLVHADAWL